MDAEKIARKARKSIGNYCIAECKAYCCRKGYLVMNKLEAELVTNKKLIDFEKSGNIKHMADGKYSLNLDFHDVSCPSLKDFKCTIHKKLTRPSACKDFPLFLNGFTLRLSSRCPAVRAGLLYPYIRRLLLLGYKLQEGDSFVDSDFYDLDLCKKAVS